MVRKKEQEGGEEGEGGRERGGKRGQVAAVRMMGPWGEGFCPRLWVSLAWSYPRRLPR